MKVTIRYAGHKWSTSGTLIARDAVEKSLDDTSISQSGVHYYHPNHDRFYDDPVVGGRDVVCKAIYLLSKRQLWYDHATMLRKFDKDIVRKIEPMVMDKVDCRVVCTPDNVS